MTSPRTRNTTSVLKLLDLFILIFLGLGPIWHILSTIVPFITLTYRLHLSRIPYYLRNTGIILSIAELILCRKLRKGPHVGFLYGICGTAVLSSLLERKYGYEANINSIAWMMVVFVIFYSASYRISRNKFRTSVLILFSSLFVIWFLATCLSLHQFTHLIGAASPQKVSSLWLSGNGFYKNRLYGVFAFPEYGAVTGLMLMIACAYLFFRTRIIPLRILIVFLNFPFFWYLVLSGSRNARVSLYATVFVGAFFLLRTHFSKAGSLSPKTFSGVVIFKALAGALAALTVIHILYNATLTVSEKVPGMFEQTTDDTASVDSENKTIACILIPIRNLTTQKTGSVPGGAVIEATDPVKLRDGNIYPVLTSTSSGNGEKTGSKSETGKTSNAKKKNDKKEKTEQEGEESLLGRKDVQHNPGTFRMEIWKDYLGLYKDVGLFGLSPENNSKYIQEHYPDLFIVDYIRRAYPEDYEKGYVFHPHSGYLKVFVSTGFLGLFFLLSFLFLCSANVFFYLKSTARLPLDFLFSFLIVFAGALTAVFDTELFFSFNPVTFLFWLALSAMYRSMSSRSV